MWTAKIKISSKKTLIGSIAEKSGIDLVGYPISSYREKNSIISFIVGEIFGEDNVKKNFVSALKKNKRILQIEIKKDFISALIKEPLKVKDFYNPRIIYLKPIFVSKEGYEIYNVAAWNRMTLMKFVGLLEKIREGKLIKIKQEKISTVSIVRISPELTFKQKKAVEIAIKNGYYDYPRRIKLEKLAKLINISYSTFQAHLRKAEQKLIPFFFEKI